jgi:hypothetical protein
MAGDLRRMADTLAEDIPAEYLVTPLEYMRAGNDR